MFRKTGVCERKIVRFIKIGAKMIMGYDECWYYGFTKYEV